jgi:hypothetical protein
MAREAFFRIYSMIWWWHKGAETCYYFNLHTFNSYTLRSCWCGGNDKVMSCMILALFCSSSHRPVSWYRWNCSHYRQLHFVTDITSKVWNLFCNCIVFFWLGFTAAAVTFGLVSYLHVEATEKFKLQPWWVVQKSTLLSESVRNSIFETTLCV